MVSKLPEGVLNQVSGLKSTISNLFLVQAAGATKVRVFEMRKKVTKTLIVKNSREVNQETKSCVFTMFLVQTENGVSVSTHVQ